MAAIGPVYALNLFDIVDREVTCPPRIGPRYVNALQNDPG